MKVYGMVVTPEKYDQPVIAMLAYVVGLIIGAGIMQDSLLLILFP